MHKYLEEIFHRNSHLGLMNERHFEQGALELHRRWHEHYEKACGEKIRELEMENQRRMELMMVEFYREMQEEKERCRKRVKRARETMVERHARVAAWIRAHPEKRK